MGRREFSFRFFRSLIAISCTIVYYVRSFVSIYWLCITISVSTLAESTVEVCLYRIELVALLLAKERENIVYNNTHGLQYVKQCAERNSICFFFHLFLLPCLAARARILYRLLDADRVYWWYMCLERSARSTNKCRRFRYVRPLCLCCCIHVK